MRFQRQSAALERYRNVTTTLQLIRVFNMDAQRWEDYTSAAERAV